MKTIIRIGKWGFLSILGLVFLLFLILLFEGGAKAISFSKEELAALIKVQPDYSSEVDSVLYYQLEEAFGNNKNLAPGFEYQCLLALSHYPELKETPIDFLYQPSFLPLSSRPDPKTLVMPWKKRRYLVVISSESADFFEKILLKNTPFNDQIGIIGHELAHTVFYQDKNAFYLIKLAYDYQYNKKFTHDFERATDKSAIAHGLGYQMYDFAFFVRRAFGDTNEEIEAEEGDMYLSPKEIIKEMQAYDFYDANLINIKKQNQLK